MMYHFIDEPWEYGAGEGYCTYGRYVSYVTALLVDSQGFEECE